jgi:DNA-binding transcriptional regulator GbsR (MarR family)
MSVTVRPFIEGLGNATQSFGLGRVVGQIYAYLYFSLDPRSLSDMQIALGISKGSASMGVRQLEQWSAVRKVWIKGDRKDYYEANDWFGLIVKSVIRDVSGKRMNDFARLVAAASASFATTKDGSREHRFVRDRVTRLQHYAETAQNVWSNPLVQKFLG